jgi:hypothetical protein
MTRAQFARLVLLVAAAFLVTMAALLRYYVYQGGLVLPLEQRRTYHLAAPAATYLDTATLQVRTGVPVVDTVSLYGDAQAGDARTAVWAEFSSLETEFGQRIDYHERRTAFDRRTGLAVNCCDEYIDNDTGVRQTGLAFRLPYNAAPREYPMFDPVLKREIPLRYEAEETIDGLPVYRYTYTVGPAAVEDLPDELPGRMLGLPGAGLVGVSRYVRIARTLWVEPESGLPVRMREQRLDTLRTPDQVDRLISLQADMITEPQDVADMVAEADTFRRWAILVRDVLPVACLALALIPALAARWVRRRSGPGDGPQGLPPGSSAGDAPAAQHQQQVPGHDLAETG